MKLLCEVMKHAGIVPDIVFNLNRAWRLVALSGTVKGKTWK